MPRIRLESTNRQHGIIILLVAVVLLFVVGAMAALSIDVVTFYTARSEAQLAADAAALAGARVLANSGFTSTSAISATTVQTLATNVADQIAMSNKVGGSTLNLAEVTVSYPNGFTPAFATNPHIKVTVTRTDIPTFFARVWGRTTVTVTASATAEAYNPSPTTPSSTVVRVAPSCVKPWLLPNISPTPASAGNQEIFEPSSGAVQDGTLLGWTSLTSGTQLMYARCRNRCNLLPGPLTWRYYPGDPSSTNFPPPDASTVQCSGSNGFNDYELSVAGCVQRPIVCNSFVSIDINPDPNRNSETAAAVNCMTHSGSNGGDSVDPASVPPQPFQFLTGAYNPLVQAGAIAAGTDIMVSDSVVTVPVVNLGPGAANATNPVQIIGFVQLFLNPDGLSNSGNGEIQTTVINLAGCGTAASGQPILGNGASPVPVRLIAGP